MPVAARAAARRARARALARFFHISKHTNTTWALRYFPGIQSDTGIIRIDFTKIDVYIYM